MHSTPKLDRHIKRLSLAAVGLALIGGARLKAIAPIGDNSELFVTGTLSAEYDDNIFLSHTNETDDGIYDFVPGLSYEFGKNNSLATGQLAVSEDFQVFQTKSNLNNDLFNGTFWTKYDDQTSSFNFDASMHQLDQAERTIQNLNYLVDRNVYHVDGIGEIQLSDKSAIGSGVIWDDTDYKTNGFTDWRYIQIPVNYYFKFEPKLDLSAGFQFQDNTLGIGGTDSNVYFYNVGARGEFTPNLTGTFRIGYIQQDMDGGQRHSGVGSESSFTYAYSPKTNITAGINDDFGYAAIGDAYRDFGVYAGFTTALTDQWSGNGQLAYNRYSYDTSGQLDDFYTLRLGLTYVWSTNLTIAGAYTYAYDNSNIALYTFKNNILSISASIHF